MKKEKNPIEKIWNCYSPYVKGKKEDIEKLFEDKVITKNQIGRIEESNDIVSFRIMGNHRFAWETDSVDADLIMHIIKDYPDLIVACVFTGDPFAEVRVAVVISEYGYPFITKGEIIGTDGTDDTYTMDEFNDLFMDYHKEETWEDPRTGIEWELEVEYSFPFYTEWDSQELMKEKIPY